MAARTRVPDPGPPAQLPTPALSRKVRPRGLNDRSAKSRDWGKGGKGRPPPAPHASPSASLGNRMKGDHLPAGTASRPSWAASCQPSPGMARPLRAGAPALRAIGPEEGPRAAGWARLVATRPGWPGRPQSSEGRRVGPEVEGGEVVVVAGGPAGEGVRRATGVAPRRSPGRPAAHLLQAARGVRRGASGDRLLSAAPLFRLQRRRRGLRALPIPGLE